MAPESRLFMGVSWEDASIKSGDWSTRSLLPALRLGATPAPRAPATIPFLVVGVVGPTRWAIMPGSLWRPMSRPETEPVRWRVARRSPSMESSSRQRGHSQPSLRRSSRRVVICRQKGERGSRRMERAARAREAGGGDGKRAAATRRSGDAADAAREGW